MIIVLEIGAAFVLTGALATFAMIVSAFELGCLATPDDEQREVETGADRVPSTCDRSHAR